MPSGTRTVKKIVGAISLTAFFLVYLVPLFGVSVLANFSALSAYVDNIAFWITNYPTSFSIFIAVVPPFCSILLQLMLPMVIRWIIQSEGVISHSQMDRVVTARYSAFLLLSQFFIFSVLSVIIQLSTFLSLSVSLFILFLTFTDMKWFK